MSPIHHDTMIDIVTSELNIVWNKVQKLTGYHGKVSILAHSLGSVICWDILSHQKRVHGLVSAIQRGVSSNGRFNGRNFLEAPETGYLYPSLDFEVVHNFLIGSPCAVFLMMRNQNNPSNSQAINLPGCQNIYNIFHPHDPLAYRLEPIVEKEKRWTEPVLIPHWKFGLRFHYQTKFWFKTLLHETEKVKESAVQALEDRIDSLSSFGNIVDEIVDKTAPSLEETGEEIGNERRLDFMLQEHEIENANEYLSALAAHSSYWENKDLSLFIAKQL